MMHRRAFLAGMAGAVALSPSARAQQPTKIHRLGILSPAAVPDPSVATTPNLVPLALRDLGYIERENLVIEKRFAEGKLDRLRVLARQLVELRVDVIMAVSTAIDAAKDVTATTPIVMAFGDDDPVRRRWVASLARPEGNITGVVFAVGAGLASKRMELIKAAVPQAVRIAVLASGEPGSTPQVQEAEKAASALGVKLIVFEVQGTDYERAFATMTAERAEAVFVLASTIFNRDRKQIIESAQKYKLPAMYEWREQAQLGGLMSYGSSLVDLSKRVAAHIDKIFRGTRPADLPVEQPTKFELVINLKTAKALGLTIPPSLLLRADQVIQ